jgi:hypothetical protein
VSDEKVLNDDRKSIVQSIIDELSQSDPNLYYTNTSIIAQMVYQQIQDKKINRHDFEKMKDLSAADILILISYKSSCCSVREFI